MLSWFSAYDSCTLSTILLSSWPWMAAVWSTLAMIYTNGHPGGLSPPRSFHSTDFWLAVFTPRLLPSVKLWCKPCWLHILQLCLCVCSSTMRQLSSASSEDCVLATGTAMLPVSGPISPCLPLMVWKWCGYLPMTKSPCGHLCLTGTFPLKSAERWTSWLTLRPLK